MKMTNIPEQEIAVTDLSSNELLDLFVAQYESGAQGANMDCDTAQALALAIKELRGEK